MTTFEKIKILKKAERDLKKAPKEKLKNKYGLGYYLQQKHSLCENEIHALLGDDFKDTYELSNWYKKRIVEILTEDSYDFDEKNSTDDTIIFRKNYTLTFIKFLKKEKAYEAYMDNIKIENQRWVNANDYYDDINHIKTLSKNKWISGAFNWTMSKKGFKYWNDLHEKWADLLKTADNVIMWD